MTKKEIEKQIKKEERRMASLKSHIDNLKFAVKVERKAIRFWNAELKKAK